MIWLYIVLALGAVAAVVMIWVRIVDVAFVDRPKGSADASRPRGRGRPCRWCGTEPRTPVPAEHENVLELFPIPDCDCEERAYCDKAGVPGHYSCGWCEEHDQPVHVCHNEGRFETCGRHRSHGFTLTTEGGEHR